MRGEDVRNDAHTEFIHSSAQRLGNLGKLPAVFKPNLSCTAFGDISRTVNNILR